MGILSDTKGQLTPQSMVGSGQISNSFATLLLSSLPARVLTTLNIDFPDTQGQLTMQSAIGFSRISNSS